MNNFRTELKNALPSLWRYAFALSRDRAKADDLVQDCAERALLKHEGWNSARPIKPWLMTILLNIYRNQYRRDNYLRLVPYEEDHSGYETSLQDESRTELCATLSGINLLPPEQREALLSVVVGGLDYSQAAKTLNIPQGTLMSRISRARAKLRKMRSDENGTVRRIR